jgi:subtilisin-like proprotein convertase family protein
LPEGGAYNTGSPQNYGFVATGATVTRSFSFLAGGNCGEQLMLTLELQDGSADLGKVYIPISLGALGSAVTNSYSGPPVSIPDGFSSVDVPVAVSGITGAIGNISFRFDGNSCNATPGSTTVGLDHSFVGDLTISLISPAGTQIVLMDQIGSPIPTSGVNLCNLDLNDSAVSSIQAVPYNAAGPFSGSYKPDEALSAFDGENPNGTWKLRVVDNYGGYSGHVRAFSLIISPRVCCGSGSTFSTFLDDPFNSGNVQPSGSTTGWSTIGQDDPTLVSPDYDNSTGAYRVNVFPSPGRYHLSGWIGNHSTFLPYSSVGSSNYVRAKFYMYTGGQSDPNRLDTIPNFKLRVANRFAVTADLQLTLHNAQDTPQLAYSSELRPSSNPQKPSIYRVDFDPVDVPFLQTSTTDEGILAGFDIFTLEPQDNGYIAMTELQFGTYPASLLSAQNALQSKVYAPDATGASGLHLQVPGDLSIYNLIALPGPQGTPAQTDPLTPTGTTSEGTFGVTLDTRAVPADRIGVIDRAFFAGNADGTAGYSQRIRSAENQVYKVRWHITSTQPTSNQSWIWLQQRSIKFAYSQTLELAGGYSSNSPNSLAVVRQTLPGIGCLNPDKINPGENGGWYTALLTSPMNRDIRPEFSADSPLTQRMPDITSLPGPGVDSTSNRDVKLATQVYDSISVGTGHEAEGGFFTIDRIEVQAFNLIDD